MKNIRFVTLNSRIFKVYSLLLILMILLVIAVIGVIIVRFILSQLYNNLDVNTYQQALLIDTQLEEIATNSRLIALDETLMDIASGNHSMSKTEIREAVEKTKRILTRYFTQQSILSVQLAIDYNRDGNIQVVYIGENSSIPVQNLLESDIYREISEIPGNLMWVPTYTFHEKYKIGYLYDMQYSYSKLFTAAKVIRLVPYGGSFQYYRQDLNGSPVLLINFTSSFFDQMLQPDKTEMEYIVTDQNQAVIASSFDAYQTGNTFSDPPKRRIVSQNGKLYVASESMLRIPRWTLHTYTELNSSLSNLKIGAFISGAIIVLIFTIGLIATFYIAKSITKRIGGLSLALEKSGQGSFDCRLSESGNDEISYIIRQFNKMNHSLNVLVNEKYHAVLKMKEAQIMMLGYQLNPHLLYNVLSHVNLLAINHGEQEISDILVSTASVLYHMLRDTRMFVPLREEIIWQEAYVDMLRKLYDDPFTYETEIDPGLLDTSVPKLLFQPLIENSVIHGMGREKKQNYIKLRGWRSGNDRFFSVSDNGIGTKNDLVRFLDSSESSGLGLKNVQNRIKNLYGDEYTMQIEDSPVQGICIVIRLPLSP